MKFELYENYESRHAESVKKVREFLESKGKLEATDREIEELWSDFSYTWSASWLIISEGTLNSFWRYFCKENNIYCEDGEE